MTTNLLRQRRLRSGAALLALTIGLSSAPAFAQDSATTTAQSDGMIIVTGSRIARPDIESSSPVSFVGAEEFQFQQTANVEEVLNDLPQIIPATTGVSNNPGGGVATVDIRGLGTSRTLVLVDGRRYISYGTNQVVDLNTIPSALIERVDVVTGGASAVYGSDAIAGVVNFITKTDFEGIELNGNYEVSEQGDGQRYNINGTIGSNFSDGRGNIVMHVDYYKRDAVFAGDRDATRDSFSDNGSELFPGGSSSIPSFRLVVPGLAQALGLGTGANDAVRFDENGNAIEYNPATDLYNFGPVNYLQVPQERYLGYVKAQYEISEAIVPYAEAAFINNRVSTELAATPIGNSTPFRDGSLGSNLMLHVYSPFLGAETAAALQALDTDGDGYVSSGTYGRRFLETGSRSQMDDRNAFRVLAGVKGDLGGNWAYDAYYQYSRTRNSQIQGGNIQLSALLAGVRTAFQAPDGTISATPVAGGTLVCADAGARANGCSPVNLFGANQVGADAVDYISISASNLTEASTKVYSGVITNNNLFDLGAGPIGIALGVERREESATFQPDTFLASGNVGGFNAGQPTSGGYDVTEFFGEVNLPILSGLSWAEAIELNGAVRYSDYSNAVGGVWTWAVGGIWDVAGGFSLRGNYQQAIRGPNVEELFGGQTVDFAGASDPCQTEAAASGVLRDRCIANGVPAAVVGTDDYSSGGTSFPALVGGNPNLKEESAKTWTIGAVYLPEFVDGLSLTLDYYNITVDDYIGTVGNQNIVNACLREGISQYCDLITRSSTGELQSFVDLNFNAASLHTEGLDLGARYSLPLGAGILGGGSSLSFDFKGTYLFSLDYDAVAGLGLPVNECAGRFGRVCSNTVAFGPTPHWRNTLRTTYRDGDAYLSVLWRHIGASNDDDDTTTYAVEHLNSADYFDLTAGYDINEHFSLAAGVKNVFNKGFEPLASSQQGGNGQQSNTYPATYDVLGRYFSLSAKVSF